MKHSRMILLAWLTMLAGCGESSQEQLARSPEVQRRLKEIAEKNRALEQKRQRIIDARRRAATNAEPLEEASLPGAENGASEDTTPENTVPESKPPDEQPATRPAGPPEVPRLLGELDRWRKLRAGLPQKIIRQLLGAPTVTKRDVFLEYWYYGQGAGAGRVSFVKRSGKTFGWSPPLQP